MKEEIENLKKFAKLSKDVGQDFFMHPDSALEFFAHVEFLQSRMESLEKDAARLRLLTQSFGLLVKDGALNVEVWIKSPDGNLNACRRGLDAMQSANKGV